MELGRVLTAMVTPFTATGEVNIPEAARLAAHLADNGSDAIVVCGTTGESPTLTWEEEYDLFCAVRDAVKGKAKVVAGTGSNSTREAVSATEKAAKLGLDATLQVVPYYNKPSQAGLYEHFYAVAQCSELPVVLYNIPSRTGIALQPETVAKLAQHPNVIGIKEASGGVDSINWIRSLTDAEFLIYAGDDSLTLPLLALGAAGVVSVASHLVGNELQLMIQAFVNGDPDKALSIHTRLLPLFRDLFIDSNPVPVKTALRWQGWLVGSVRPPLVPMAESLQARLRDTLTRLQLL